jgi:hypothetical protein
LELTFIQLRSFVSAWRELRLSDVDLQALELELLRRPEAGKVIRGTGRLRKLRFAPPTSGRGKSGGTRVIYAHFPSNQCVYLFTIYGKNVQEDLNADDKAYFAGILERLEAWLRQQGRR